MAYPSRHERGYDSNWVRTREVALRRDDYLCVPCRRQGRTTLAKEVDHITPKKQGGTNDLDNLQSICTDCHKAKTRAENSTTLIPVGEDGWPIAQRG
ncbi:HNH endonuclease [Dinoroseobacter sp. S375]|uniref:HNH endonuclease n=1 Tax=Dinoroseobacter sp. S375 TaxID=3415136 RepID=UPI003C7B3A03